MAAKQMTLGVAKKQPSKLAEYTRLRKQAKAKGLTVPRGTSLAELRALLAGKATTEQVRETVKRKRQSKAKPKKVRVPSGAKTIQWGWGW